MASCQRGINNQNGYMASSYSWYFLYMNLYHLTWWVIILLDPEVIIIFYEGFLLNQFLSNVSFRLGNYADTSILNHASVHYKCWGGGLSLIASASRNKNYIHETIIIITFFKVKISRSDFALQFPLLLFHK